MARKGEKMSAPKMTANEIVAALNEGITDDLLVAYFRSQAEGFDRRKRAKDVVRSVPTEWLHGLSDMLDRQKRPLPLIMNMFDNAKGRQIVDRKTIDTIVEWLNTPVAVKE